MIALSSMTTSKTWLCHIAPWVAQDERRRQANAKRQASKVEAILSALVLNR